MCGAVLVVLMCVGLKALGVCMWKPKGCRLGTDETRFDLCGDVFLVFLLLVFVGRIVRAKRNR